MKGIHSCSILWKNLCRSGAIFSLHALIQGWMFFCELIFNYKLNFFGIRSFMLSILSWVNLVFVIFKYICSIDYWDMSVEIYYNCRFIDFFQFYNFCSMYFIIKCKTFMITISALWIDPFCIIRWLFLILIIICSIIYYICYFRFLLIKISTVYIIPSFYF